MTCVCPICNGDCASANPPVYNCPMQAVTDLLATLRWVRANYASGSTKEINDRIDAAISKATGA